MRGSEELLIDMLYEKERVHGALNKIRNVWDRINTEIYDIIKENNEGGSSIGWLNTWAPGKHGQMQCDISVMISPDMFSEFVIDELNVQSEFYDYPLYHLDGMEQVRHLDNILAIEKLRAIQWTCVDGQPSPVKFIPELKRIQTAGKSLLIRIKSKDMEPLMEQLSSKGLHLVVEDASSKEEADYLVKRACELTHE
jgi:hypothetical protein